MDGSTEPLRMRLAALYERLAEAKVFEDRKRKVSNAIIELCRYSECEYYIASERVRAIEREIDTVKARKGTLWRF